MRGVCGQGVRGAIAHVQLSSQVFDCEAAKAEVAHVEGSIKLVHRKALGQVNCQGEFLFRVLQMEALGCFVVEVGAGILENEVVLKAAVTVLVFNACVGQPFFGDEIHVADVQIEGELLQAVKTDVKGGAGIRRVVLNGEIAVSRGVRCAGLNGVRCRGDNTAEREMGSDKSEASHCQQDAGGNGFPVGAVLFHRTLGRMIRFDGCRRSFRRNKILIFEDLLSDFFGASQFGDRLRFPGFSGGIKILVVIVKGISPLRFGQRSQKLLKRLHIFGSRHSCPPLSQFS